MLKCIICNEEKSEFTEEHIFPESIGGALTFDDGICKDCNDYLGHSVDNFLVNHWLIQGARLVLGLPGKDGHIPNPLREGVLENNPEQKVLYEFDDQGNPERFKFLPNIQKEKHDDGSKEISITIDKSDEDSLVDMVNKILEREGNEQRVTKEDIQKFMEDNRIEHPKMHLSPTLDITDYYRTFLKIAYELIYYWFGQEGISNPLSQNIREIIYELPKDNWFELAKENYELRGTIKPMGDNPMVPDLPGLPSWHHEINSHSAFLINIDDFWACYITIFDIFEGVIPISTTIPITDNYDLPIVVNNPLTGEIHEDNLGGEIAENMNFI